jgi:NNP family nitrate/nitrite transporter-like MFS transporter
MKTFSKRSIAMSTINEPSGPRLRVMWISTIAFTLMFNVWLMLGVLGIPIRNALHLSDSQLEWLIATAILSGSLLRLHFGIWADRFGGRNTMIFLLLLSAIPTYIFSQAESYGALLLCSFLFGLAGNSFAVGISWNSAWFPPQQKGTALGVFGAGNVGASGTKLLVVLFPALLTLIPAGGYLGGWIPGGWRFIPAVYAILLLVMAWAVWWFSPVPDRMPGKGRPMKEMMAPLRFVRVWRLSLYYVVVFGAYVALSGWLPKYYIDTYGLSLHTAALLTATFIFPASLLRPLGGYLSDIFGPRVVTYIVFLVMTLCLIVLSIPNGEYFGTWFQLTPWAFALLMFGVGCCMGIGKASTYKYIPNYFPNDVGAVGGMVGLLGALGGFFLPPLFGYMGRQTGVPQTAFLALLALTLASLVWLHLVVVKIRARESIRYQNLPLETPQLVPSAD